MNEQSEMAIIAIDLYSIALRIEALQAHPKLTDAGDFTRLARDAVKSAAAKIHHSDMSKRHA